MRQADAFPLGQGLFAQQLLDNLILSFLAESLLPESNATSLSWEAVRQAFEIPRQHLGEEA